MKNCREIPRLNNIERVIITGASGFIGKAVVPLLLDSKIPLMALSTRPVEISKTWGIDSMDIRELSQESSLERLRGFSPTVLLHLGWSRLPDYSTDACLDNLISSIEILRASIDCGVKRVVAAGSCWEYGDLKGELSEHTSVFPTSIFTKTKNNLRNILESVGEDTGIETRWARIFYSYGPGQREQSLIPFTIRSWKNGEAPALRDTESAIDLIHVQDVATGLVALTLKKGPSGVFNLGSGSATKVSDVVQYIKSCVSGNNVSHSFLMQDGESAAWANLESMSKHFDWKPKTSLAEGIRGMV